MKMKRYERIILKRLGVIYVLKQSIVCIPAKNTNKDSYLNLHLANKYVKTSTGLSNNVPIFKLRNNRTP